MPGRAVTFGRPKVTKNHHGASPPGTPGKAVRRIWCFQNIPFLTFTEVPLLAGRLCANRTKPNQARLLTLWALLFGSVFAQFSAIRHVGAGLTRPLRLRPAAGDECPPVSPCCPFPPYRIFSRTHALCRARRPRRAAGFPPGLGAHRPLRLRPAAGDECPPVSPCCPFLPYRIFSRTHALCRARRPGRAAGFPPGLGAHRPLRLRPAVVMSKLPAWKEHFA